MCHNSLKLNMKAYKLVIIYTIFSQCSALFKSNYKEMLNKAKDYYKTKFKHKTWNIMGYDSSEYPGTITKYRQINKQKWDEYYECLKIQNFNLGKSNSMNPTAVVGFEGGVVSFDCKVCLSPNERDNIESVEWYWAPIGSKAISPVEYTEHITLAPEDKTLTLYNLEESQSGQYICKLGAALTAPCFLTVIKSTSKIVEVHTKVARTGPYPSPQSYISQFNLILDTVWGSWSHCNTCEKVGRRHKLGYCVIFMKDNQFLTRSKKDTKNNIINNTYTSTENLKTNVSIDEHNISKQDLEIFTIFEGGIPCLSHILPKSLKQLPPVQRRISEIMIGYCKVPCIEDSIFQVKNKNGEVIETANNSAGIYSMLQGIPPVEPAVSRQLQYEKTDTNIILTCPGQVMEQNLKSNLNTDTPVQWQLGSKKIIPELIVKQSNGRIYISVMEKIYIKRAKVVDSNIYSCWQNNELAGTIRLVVEKQIKMTFNHHIMLLGMVIILSVFVYVFGKAFLGRKYAE